MLIFNKLTNTAQNSFHFNYQLVKININKSSELSVK